MDFQNDSNQSLLSSKQPSNLSEYANSTKSSEISTPKDAKTSLKHEPIEALSVGLLSQFTSLKDLETQLEQIICYQKTLIENIVMMNCYYTQNEELQEVQLMVR